jgi:hypothetical protein
MHMHAHKCPSQSNACGAVEVGLIDTIHLVQQVDHQHRDSVQLALLNKDIKSILFAGTGSNKQT